MSETSGAGEIAEKLLRATPRPAGGTAAGERRLLVGKVLGSIFVAYHLAVLLVYNLPSQGPPKDFRKQFLETFQGSFYINGSGQGQSWSMFAPNPNRTNSFIRVLVVDQAGDVWDMKHDIWGDYRYPYMVYDRIGKINRRIDGKASYQQVYGAWMCRDWERRTGKPAKSVHFVKRFTKVPEPGMVPPAARTGMFSYDPWKLPYQEKAQETINCATAANAQIPDDLRERWGMGPREGPEFKHVPQRSWRETFYREISRVSARVISAGRRFDPTRAGSGNDGDSMGPLDPFGMPRQPIFGDDAEPLPEPDDLGALD